MVFAFSEVHDAELNFKYVEKTETICDSMLVSVTFYNSLPEQTDDTPFITADGTHVRDGIIAVSPDMLRMFSYGDSIYVENYGFFEIHDRMHHRFHNSVDIWCRSYREAIRNGRKQLKIYYNHRIHTTYTPEIHQ